MLNKIIKLGYTNQDAEELLKVSKDIEKDYLLLKQDYPIQYLIGYVNFYGNNINVNENVLIPRFETEFLVEKTIKYIQQVFNNKKIHILDLATGSGAIAISISKETNSEVDASDISDKALKVAKNNSKENNCNIKFIQSDIFDKITDKYDVIISNPPYISKNEIIMDKVFKYEPHLALFAEDDGLYFYKEIIKNSKKFLNDKYIMAFEIGMTQGNDLIEYSKSIFSNKKIIVEKDLSGKDRYLFIISE